jgi:hypothetical protein
VRGCLVLTPLLVAVLTAPVSVNGSVAPLLPVVAVMAVRLRRSPSQLMMPLAFGAHFDLTELLVINSGVSLLASFIPVPGGIGVAEFGPTIGLTSAGMVPEAAIAAVLLYRISTYYLPPVRGFPAMLWLQRNRYL